MSDEKKLGIEYSAQSLNDAVEIITYLRKNFSQKEVSNFYQSLTGFENIVSIFPNLYPESAKIKARRAVLSKVLSVYYMISKNRIVVVSIMDNRRDMGDRL